MNFSLVHCSKHVPLGRNKYRPRRQKSSGTIFVSAKKRRTQARDLVKHTHRTHTLQVMETNCADHVGPTSEHGLLLVLKLDVYDISVYMQQDHRHKLVGVVDKSRASGVQVGT